MCMQCLHYIVTLPTDPHHSSGQDCTWRRAHWKQYPCKNVDHNCWWGHLTHTVHPVYSVCEVCVCVCVHPSCHRHNMPTTPTVLHQELSLPSSAPIIQLVTNPPYWAMRTNPQPSARATIHLILCGILIDSQHCCNIPHPCTPPPHHSTQQYPQYTAHCSQCMKFRHKSNPQSKFTLGWDWSGNKGWVSST